ncbi:MAG TPA: glucose 1-dehydrogenase [Acidimicrobiales bacterium]|nr:glucose 1-dehydrogenase [Acidimicrobiales bacterium]
MAGHTALFDLTGKVAIVTGSTKGIGRAMVEGLAAAGAAVVVSSRKQDLCNVVAEEVRASTGADVMALACHVGEWDAIPAFVEAVADRFGRVDVLVNNAGINPANMTATEMTLEYWRKVFSVNLEGPLRMSQQVAPVMRDGGGGSIINIGTMAAYGPGPNICAYGASKAALLNLTKAMATEWVPWNVRVNMLSPGPFMSEMMEGGAKNREGFIELVTSGTLMKRVARPEEIVGPVIYLASEASSFVTGDDLSVSGGMRK